MLQRSMQKHMQHRKRKTRIVRMSNKSMRRRRPQMQVVALLTLPKAADYMPIAPAVSGNDQVKDRQLQRKQHAAWPWRSADGAASRLQATFGHTVKTLDCGVSSSPALRSTDGRYIRPPTVTYLCVPIPTIPYHPQPSPARLAGYLYDYA